MGEYYRGNLSHAASGRHCAPWAHQLLIKPKDHTELLGGHRYCRNPGARESQPFCYTEVDELLVLEICDIPHCSKF